MGTWRLRVGLKGGLPCDLVFCSFFVSQVSVINYVCFFNVWAKVSILDVSVFFLRSFALVCISGDFRGHLMSRF